MSDLRNRLARAALKTGSIFLQSKTTEVSETSPSITGWLFRGQKLSSYFIWEYIIYNYFLVFFIKFWTLHNTSLNGSGRYILGVWDRELKDKNSQEQFADNYDITLLSNLTAFLSLKFLQLLASNIPVIWIKLVKRPMKDNWFTGSKYFCEQFKVQCLKNSTIFYC